MAATVPTVGGEVEVDALGVTLMHEHVFTLNPEIQRNYPGDWDEAERIEDAVAKLEELAGRGGQTIVDLTVVGLGRDVELVAKVAARTRINIVAATGIYIHSELPPYFRHRGPGRLLDGPEPLVEMFVGDIESGIGGTGIRAAILKCATDVPGLTPDVERVLRAVAETHKRTGVPISTHTDAGTRRGLDQQKVFAAEGVDLARIVIGHSGDSADLDYLERLIDAGSYLGMDRFGLDSRLPFDQRVAVVAELCARGFADRLVLSHDASCFNDWLEPMDPSVREEFAPRWNFTHVFDDVVPALEERGVTKASIQQMLVGNPRAIFEGDR